MTNINDNRAASQARLQLEAIRELVAAYQTCTRRTATIPRLSKISTSTH